MAKPFGGMSAAPKAGGVPQIPVRPMPRPGGLGGVEVEQAAKSSGGGFMAQQFGPQGSETRYEMAMEMLKAAMSGAAGSNNPALAFLTPIIGSAVGAKVAKQRDDLMGSEQDAMTTGLLGNNLSPQAQQALEVLNNPNAPDYLKTIAGSMLKQNIPFGQPAAKGGGRSKSRSSGGGGGRPTRPQKLTYISRDPDGVVRGYNAATGKREVVQNADAPTPTPASAAPAALPAPPDMPAMPKEPGSTADDDLINKYLGL